MYSWSYLYTHTHTLSFPFLPSFFLSCLTLTTMYEAKWKNRREKEKACMLVWECVFWRPELCLTFRKWLHFHWKWSQSDNFTHTRNYILLWQLCYFCCQWIKVLLSRQSVSVHIQRYHPESDWFAPTNKQTSLCFTFLSFPFLTFDGKSLAAPHTCMYVCVLEYGVACAFVCVCACVIYSSELNIIYTWTMGSSASGNTIFGFSNWPLHILSMHIEQLNDIWLIKISVV